MIDYLPYYLINVIDVCEYYNIPTKSQEAVRVHFEKNSQTFLDAASEGIFHLMTSALSILERCGAVIVQLHHLDFAEDFNKKEIALTYALMSISMRRLTNTLNLWIVIPESMPSKDLKTVTRLMTYFYSTIHCITPDNAIEAGFVQEQIITAKGASLINTSYLSKVSLDSIHQSMKTDHRCLLSKIKPKVSYYLKFMDGMKYFNSIQAPAANPSIEKFKDSK